MMYIHIVEVGASFLVKDLLDRNQTKSHFLCCNFFAIAFFTDMHACTKSTKENCDKIAITKPNFFIFPISDNKRFSHLIVNSQE